MVNVVCVKYGTKYTETHVNRLYEMVKRNLSLPFSFYCLTDDKRGLHEDIKTVYLNEDLELEGYWWKFCVFDPSMYERPMENTLYLDIDTIIQNNIDRLFYYVDATKLRIAYVGLCPRDAPHIKYKTAVNSSVMVFRPDGMKDIYQDFMEDSDYNILEYFGVCRYLWNNYRNRMEYFYSGKEYYSFVAQSITSDLSKFGFRLKYSRGSFDAYYLPDCPICILNNCSRLGILDEAYKFFSDYYK